MFEICASCTAASPLARLRPQLRLQRHLLRPPSRLEHRQQPRHRRHPRERRASLGVSSSHQEGAASSLDSDSSSSSSNPLGRLRLHPQREEAPGSALEGLAPNRPRRRQRQRLVEQVRRVVLLQEVLSREVTVMAALTTRKPHGQPFRQASLDPQAPTRPLNSSSSRASQPLALAHREHLENQPRRRVGLWGLPVPRLRADRSPSFSKGLPEQQPAQRPDSTSGMSQLISQWLCVSRKR